MLLAGPEVPLTGGVVGVLVNDLRCLAPQDDRGGGVRPTSHDRIRSARTDGAGSPVEPHSRVA